MTLDNQSDTSFDSTKKLRLLVSNVANPQWGLDRPSSSNFTWDFDANDSDVFTLYNFWTN